MALRPRRGWAWLAILAVAACGCASRPPKPPRPEEYPALHALVRSHNDRVRALQTTYSQGVIELDWRDESGRHFHQASLELWMTLPRKMALRVDKLGEVLFWLGSDDQRWWFFDLASKTKSLRMGPFEDAYAAQGGVLGMQPAGVVDLLGLSPIAEPDPAAALINYDSTHDAWALEATGAGGPMRVLFHRSRLLPIRVEALDDARQPVITSTLAINRYLSVRVPGVAVAAQPRMPGLVDIRMIRPSGVGGGGGGASTMDLSQGSVKIALDRATGDVGGGTLDRVFDLERLRKAMPVDEVIMTAE